MRAGKKRKKQQKTVKLDHGKDDPLWEVFLWGCWAGPCKV